VRALKSFFASASLDGDVLASVTSAPKDAASLQYMCPQAALTPHTYFALSLANLPGDEVDRLVCQHTAMERPHSREASPLITQNSTNRYFVTIASFSNCFVKPAPAPL